MEIEHAKNDIKKFHIFSMAKNLGIKFGPADIKMNDLVTFDIINAKLRDLQSTKGQGHGGQQTKNNIRSSHKR